MAKTKKPAKKKNLIKKKTSKKVATKKSTRKKPITKKSLLKKTQVVKPVKSPAAKPKAKEKNVRLKKGNVGGLPDLLLEAALKVLDERQAEDIFTVELAGKSSMADYLIIASGRAARQIGAIAHYLREAFEKLGVQHIRIEGIQEGNWVLIDAGDVIIHLFRPEVRRYYNLESIWTKDGGHAGRSLRAE